MRTSAKATAPNQPTSYIPFTPAEEQARDQREAGRANENADRAQEQANKRTEKDLSTVRIKAKLQLSNQDFADLEKSLGIK